MVKFFKKLLNLFFWQQKALLPIIIEPKQASTQKEGDKYCNRDTMTKHWNHKSP